jgi:hypothetical protein
VSGQSPFPDRVAGEIAALLSEMIRDIVRDELASLREPSREGWMTLAEAAAALGLSSAATRARVRRGQLLGETRGRRVVVSVESVRLAGGDVR